MYAAQSYPLFSNLGLAGQLHYSMATVALTALIAELVMSEGINNISFGMYPDTDLWHCMQLKINNYSVLWVRRGSYSRLQ